MNDRLVRLLAGSALLLVAGAACAAVSGQAAAESAAEVAVPHFDISRYDIRGNTLLPDALVQALVAPYTGLGRDFGDVQRAVEALENAYRERGYTMVLVMLPEQELDRGVVQLDIKQTSVGKVTLKGNQYFDEANVRRALPALQEGTTPNMSALGQSLKLANENPARRIEVQLAAGDTDGDVDATIAVADERPWKAMLNLDNTGSAQSGKTHAGVVLQHANLWGRDHVLSLQYTTSLEKPDKVGIYGFGYHVPLYALGDSIDLFASYSNVDSGSVSAGIFDLAVSGRGTTAGVRYNQNFARTDNFEPKLVYGIDHKAYRNSLQVFGIELGNDVTVHPFSVAYIGAWTLAYGDASAGLTLTRNIPGGDKGRAEDFALARLGAKPGYTTLRFSGATSRVLAGDWQLRGLVNGQYSADVLVPGEQFGIGGASSVRGFDEREISNDYGLNLNLEMYTPNWCGSDTYQCRALAFYDTGWARRNQPLPGELAGTTIASAGLGMRVFLNRYASVQVDYAHVVNAGATGRHDANRLHFRLGLSY